MHMPKPSAGHELFARIAGTWEGEETMYPSQWEPKGGTAIGRTTARVALDGFALIYDYAQERGGHTTYSGHGVFTFDPKAELYSLHWFDCMGSPPEHFTGKLEGSVLTMSHGGPGMHARITHDYSEAGVDRSRMELSPDGKEWKIFFDAVTRRR